MNTIDLSREAVETFLRQRHTIDVTKALLTRLFELCRERHPDAPPLTGCSSYSKSPLICDTIAKPLRRLGYPQCHLSSTFLSVTFASP